MEEAVMKLELEYGSAAGGGWPTADSLRDPGKPPDAPLPADQPCIRAFRCPDGLPGNDTGKSTGRDNVNW